MRVCFLTFSVLPLVAYYFTTGPFKRLWVKLGCDPRRDPHYKIYQSLDIRVKEQHVHSQVEGPSGNDDKYNRILA